MRKKLPLLPEKKIVFPREDFRKTNEWRMFRIMSEFTTGFQFIADFKKSVAIFGSANATPKDAHYQEAMKLAKLLAKKGYTIITGGGPGIMEAANRGAYEAGGESVGLNIELGEGERINNYVKKSIGFHYFFVRKVIFSFACSNYVFFPGGYGTLNEFFEMISLIQTKKISQPKSVIVVDKKFWQPLLDWLENDVYLKYKSIEKQDLKIIKQVDTIKQAAEIVE